MVRPSRERSLLLAAWRGLSAGALSRIQKSRRMSPADKYRGMIRIQPIWPRAMRSDYPRHPEEAAAHCREYRPHPEELAKQASRRMAATHGLAAILRDARKGALLRMRPAMPSQALRSPQRGRAEG